MRRLWLLVGLALLVPRPLFAETLAGVTLPDRVAVGQKTLILNGVGLRRVTMFKIKAYMAGLYLESRSSSANSIMQSTQRKRLVLHFLHDAKRSQVIKAWRTDLHDNVKDLRPLEGRLAQLASVIPDVKKGDRLTLDFSSDSLDITLQGRGRKTIQGRDFSRAMLAVWLGPAMRGDDLEAGLLGK